MFKNQLKASTGGILSMAKRKNYFKQSAEFYPTGQEHHQPSPKEVDEGHHQAAQGEQLRRFAFNRTHMTQKMLTKNFPNQASLQYVIS